MKEIINDMKNFTMKAIYACGKEVTEKADVDQLLKEMLHAGIISTIVPDTGERVHSAEPKWDKPKRVASNNNLKVYTVSFPLT